MIEHELAAGEAIAAERLVAELGDAPVELRQRVESAVSAERDKRRALEELGAQHDPERDKKWRTAGALVVGALVVVSFLTTPLVWPDFVDTASWAGILALTVAAGIGLAILAFIARGDHPLVVPQPDVRGGALRRLAGGPSPRWPGCGSPMSLRGR